MDLHMPIQGGVAVMREITRDLPTCHVFVLTTLDDDESAFEAVRAGAQAYLLKDVDGAELLYTIRGLRCGESRLTPRIARKVVAEFRRLAAPDGSPTTYTAAPVLPPKEKQGPTGRKTFNEVEDKILQLISEGTSHPHIAAFLFNRGRDREKLRNAESLNRQPFSATSPVIGKPRNFASRIGMPFV